MKAKLTARARRPPRRPAMESGAGTAGPPRSAHVVLCEHGEKSAAGILVALQFLGIEPVICRDPRALIEEAVRRPPGVVICDLGAGTREDLIVLELFRRAAPGVPLILVASEGSLETRRLVLGLRPMYYMVGPVEAAELGEAVTAALARGERARG